MAKEKVVDCRGLACPQPVIETKRTLEQQTGPFVVVVDSESSLENVTRFARSQGAEVEVEQDGAEFRIKVTPPAERPAASEEPVITCSSESKTGMVVLLSADTMGRDDRELGMVLMSAFLDTLSQFRGRVSHLVMVNTGVKLAVEGSPVIDQLRALDNIGVKILACGTCLKHFGLVEKLAVGTVSNMYDIVDTLTNARNVLRP